MCARSRLQHARDGAVLTFRFSVPRARGDCLFVRHPDSTPAPGSYTLPCFPQANPHSSRSSRAHSEWGYSPRFTDLPGGGTDSQSGRRRRDAVHALEVRRLLEDKSFKGMPQMLRSAQPSPAVHSGRDRGKKKEEKNGSVSQSSAPSAVSTAAGPPVSPTDAAARHGRDPSAASAGLADATQTAPEAAPEHSSPERPLTPQCRDGAAATAATAAAAVAPAASAEHGRKKPNPAHARSSSSSPGALLPAQVLVPSAHDPRSYRRNLEQFGYKRAYLARQEHKEQKRLVASGLQEPAPRTRRWPVLCGGSVARSHTAVRLPVCLIC